MQPFCKEYQLRIVRQSGYVGIINISGDQGIKFSGMALPKKIKKDKTPYLKV